MSLKFEDDQGVWRTIGGRKVFIREGQSMSDAMKQSGKFKLSKKQIDAGNKLNEKAENGVREDIKTFLSGKEDYEGTREEFIKDLSENWNVDKDRVEEILHDENAKHPRLFKEERGNAKENNEASKYYSKLSQYQAKEDLDMRKQWLDDNAYDPKYKKEYEEFYKQGKEYYDKKYGKDDIKSLEKQREEKFNEIVRANTDRQSIYKDAGSDEAYKNLYGKEPEKNAKNQLNESDYKKYEELTNQYHGGRKDLAKIDKQIEEYRKTHPKEETKKASGKFWEEAEKERQQIKAEATKAGKSVEEYEKQKTNEMFGKEEKSLKSSSDQKYEAYYKKENLGKPSNYQKGDKIEFDTGYYETMKGSIVREATDAEKKYNINSNLKGYIVRDVNGNEHIVSDTIKNRSKTNEGIRTLNGDYERDNKGRIVSQKEYDDFREAYKKDLISKEDYRNNNYDALNKSTASLNKIDKIAGNNDKLQKLGRQMGATMFTRWEKSYKAYIKEHPNSKLDLYTFIKMNEN